MDSNGEASSHMANVLEFQAYHQEENNQEGGGGGTTGVEGFLFPISAATNSSAPLLPWQLPPIHPSRDYERFFPSSILPPLPQPPPLSIPPFYGDLYSRRGASTSLQFSYEGGGGGGCGLIDPLGLAGFYNYMGEMSSSSSLPFGGLHAELGKMSTQEIMDAKALAASKSHSEAERRRRERINAHFAKLRSLLPSTTKTDKASLLAEVIQHVKELKRQTSEIAEESPLPTESDELTVDTTNDEDGRLLIRASLCCEDRPDLLPDLIKALKALSLRTLKAEITTIGGRVRNVLVITGDGDSEENQSISSIQEALKTVIERPTAAEESSAAGIKRQRTANLSNIVLQHSSA